MKKKILLLAAALMMFMGIVSASSINGDYKGNPIVKVMSNGKQLQSDEVPAQIYDGHTVVPISLLRQLGASVEWNQEKYTVDVKLPNQGNAVAATANIADSTKIISKEIMKLGARYYRIMYDGMGPFAEIDYDITGNDLGTLSNIAVVILKTDANELWINNYINGVKVEFVKILRNDIEAFSKGEINKLEFTNKWSYSNVAPQSTPTKQPIQVVPTTNDSAIETTIDGEFMGWTGESIFKLSNGQIWQQSSFAYTYTYAFMPKVLIYKDGNSYKMKVDGVDDIIGVKQIK